MKCILTLSIKEILAVHIVIIDRVLKLPLNDGCRD